MKNAMAKMTKLSVKTKKKQIHYTIFLPFWASLHKFSAVTGDCSAYDAGEFWRRSCTSSLWSLDGAFASSISVIVAWGLEIKETIKNVKPNTKNKTRNFKLMLLDYFPPLHIRLMSKPNARFIDNIILLHSQFVLYKRLVFQNRWL